MNILLFGATGMVGQGVLRECLLDPEVQKIVSVGRHNTGIQNKKFQEIIHENMFDYSNIEKDLTGFDACFFCLGVSSAGMSEKDYSHISYDLTLAVAQTLVRCNSTLTFTYVSGLGTDSTEKGCVMWARVKGKTENALLALPFKASYMFRPGYIQPMHGIISKTKLYRLAYSALSWMFPVMRRLFPNSVTTTEQMGRAMLSVAKKGYEKSILETKDINQLGKTENS